MSFQEQHPGPALEQKQQPEPRLRLRSDRSSTTKPSVSKPRQTRGKPKRSRALRVWAGVALALILLGCLATLAGVLYLRHVLVTSLPQIDGQRRVPGLNAPVTVTRNEQGVPTITAATLPDLLFAQGYTTAGDRLWQMDTLRRHAAGELAALLGPALVEHDRRQRYLQLRAVADRAVAQLPPDQLAQLEAYARGVNAYIDATSTQGKSLPLEFRLLAYKPARWTPRDSLLVSLAMWQDLSTEFPQKLDREALSAHLPPDLLADLYPVGSWRDQPPATQGRDLTAPHDVEQIPLDPSQSRYPAPPATGPAPADLLAVSGALGGADRCEGCRSGSNNWAVSGAHTASGAPLLANDMHLSLAIPDIWYEASLHTAPTPGDPSTARVDVTGFTLPGVPFVIVGRNPHVAWGVTNLGADVQDLRVEHLRGDGAHTKYQREDGTWAPATHHHETIQVRGGHDLTLDVLTSTHGNAGSTMETPIISPLYPGERRALSLAWTAFDPAAVSSPFLGVNAATDGASLVASLAHFGGPALNLVWADASGHIGYHALGFVPVRGSAVPRPRNLPAPSAPLEPGRTPPNQIQDGIQDEGATATPEPTLSSQLRPRWMLSAYRPLRPQPKPRPAKLPPVKAQADLPPSPPVITYTIGSPLPPVPIDALDATRAWTGYVPYDALPATVDPKNGFLATANARITPDDFPYTLADDWIDPFRVERIVHLLDGRNALTPADMLHIESDVHSDVNLALAQRLAYALDHADTRVLSPDATQLHEAANLLRGWNGAMDTASPAAAIVTVVRSALWPALLIPQIQAHDSVDKVDAKQAAALVTLYTWGERRSALEVLLQHEPARWLPKGSATWNDFLAATAASALAQAHAPRHLAGWTYGETHTVEIAHPVLGAHPLFSRLLGVQGGTGRQPAPGDGSTIDAIGAHFGPSERFIADLSRADAGLGNVTTGESANPRSPWYLDQFRPWLTGRSFPLPGAQTQARHTLTLSP